MQPYSRSALDDRRRRLQSFSRYEETPRQLVIELTPDGTDYISLGDFHQEEFIQTWHVLRLVLEDARYELTRKEIREQWPPDFSLPDLSTLWRWLDRAVSQALVCREGTGRKSDPYRFWLPGQPERWRDDPLSPSDLNELFSS